MVIKATLSLSLPFSPIDVDATLARTPPQLRCLCKGVVSSRLIRGRISCAARIYTRGIRKQSRELYIALKIGRFGLTVSDDLIKSDTWWIIWKGGFAICQTLENGYLVHTKWIFSYIIIIYGHILCFIFKTVGSRWLLYRNTGNIFAWCFFIVFVKHSVSASYVYSIKIRSLANNCGF